MNRLIKKSEKKLFYHSTKSWNSFLGILDNGEVVPQATEGGGSMGDIPPYMKEKYSEEQLKELGWTQRQIDAMNIYVGNVFLKTVDSSKYGWICISLELDENDVLPDREGGQFYHIGSISDSFFRDVTFHLDYSNNMNPYKTVTLKYKDEKYGVKSFTKPYKEIVEKGFNEEELRYLFLAGCTDLERFGLTDDMINESDKRISIESNPETIKTILDMGIELSDDEVIDAISKKPTSILHLTSYNQYMDEQFLDAIFNSVGEEPIRLLLESGIVFRKEYLEKWIEQNPSFIFPISVSDKYDENTLEYLQMLALSYDDYLFSYHSENSPFRLSENVQKEILKKTISNNDIFEDDPMHNQFIQESIVSQIKYMCESNIEINLDFLIESFNLMSSNYLNQVETDIAQNFPKVMLALNYFKGTITKEEYDIQVEQLKKN